MSMPLPAPLPESLSESPPEPLLLSAEEAAAQLRVSRARMFDLIRKRKVVSVKVGASRRVSYDSLRAYVDQLIAEQAPAGPEGADAA